MLGKPKGGSMTVWIYLQSWALPLSIEYCDLLKHELTISILCFNLQVGWEKRRAWERHPKIDSHETP